jgi:hypothetical protein
MNTPLRTYVGRTFLVLTCLLMLTPDAYSQRRQRRSSSSRGESTTKGKDTSTSTTTTSTTAIIAQDDDYDDDGNLRDEFLRKLIDAKMPYIRKELAASSSEEDRDDWLLDAEGIYYEYEEYAEKSPSVGDAFLHIGNVEWEISDLVDEWYDTEDDSAEERALESRIEAAVRGIMVHKLTVMKFNLQELQKNVQEAQTNPTLALKNEVDSWLE